MVVKYLIVFFILAFSAELNSQISFGIVAVDPLTGEVGVAGGSCTHMRSPEGEAYLASDLVPGKAAMLTQGYFHKKNKENFRIIIDQGRSAESTIQWLISHDAEQLSEFRQYGLAQFVDGQVEVGTDTGSDNLQYAGEIEGMNYAVLGNSLSSEQVLVNMENGFNITNGDLADKLLGAVRGAKEVGADTRCIDSLVSSKSAYIRVAKPTDSEDDLWLDINVASTPFGVDAIDSLLNAFEAWRAITTSSPYSISEESWSIYPNPIENESVNLIWKGTNKPDSYEIYNSLGIMIKRGNLTSNKNEIVFGNNIGHQVLYMKIQDQKGYWSAVKKLVINN